MAAVSYSFYLYLFRSADYGEEEEYGDQGDEVEEIKGVEESANAKQQRILIEAQKKA